MARITIHLDAAVISIEGKTEEVQRYSAVVMAAMPPTVTTGPNGRPVDPTDFTIAGDIVDVLGDEGEYNALGADLWLTNQEVGWWDNTTLQWLGSCGDKQIDGLKSVLSFIESGVSHSGPVEAARNAVAAYERGD